MSIQRNDNRTSDISASQADKWLEDNQHRTSEHMTGKLVSDAVICKLRRSINHACAAPNPDTPLQHWHK